MLLVCPGVTNHLGGDHDVDNNIPVIFYIGRLLCIRCSQVIGKYSALFLKNGKGGAAHEHRFACPEEINLHAECTGHPITADDSVFVQSGAFRPSSFQLKDPNPIQRGACLVW